MSKYGVFSGPYFPVFRLNMDIYGVNLRIQSEYRKTWTIKNFVFGHFSRSELPTTYQVLNFTFKIKSKTALPVFQTHFTEVRHPYSTTFSEDSFVDNQIVLTQRKFTVSSRDPRLWNKLLNWQ